MSKIYLKFFLFSLSLLIIYSGNISAQISTFAGRHFYLGDGGAATSAGLFGPYAVAFDASGNMYIATSNDNRVREVNATTKVITTIAGTGIAGYSGDGGLATAAELNFNMGTAVGIAVDKSGNIFIGDYNNNRVRRVDAATHIITTIAGNGGNGYSGDTKAATVAELSGPAGVAVDTAGNVYFADNNNSVIREVNIKTGIITTVAGNFGNGGFYLAGDGGPATSDSVALNYPVGIALDTKGNLYIADAGNNVIREVNASTKIITRVAGISGGTFNPGVAGFSGDGGKATAAALNYPVGVAVDASGNLYIADQANNRIREVAASTGDISTIAGSASKGYTGDGGSATAATLNSPVDLAMNSNKLYIADNGNNVIRQVSGGTISMAAGDGTNGFTGVQPALKAQIMPVALAINYPPGGSTGGYDVLIADGAYYDVRDINDANNAYIYAGAPNPDPAYASRGYTGNGVTPALALFNTPVGVAADASSNLYVADVFNNVIREVPYGTNTVNTFAGSDATGYDGDGGKATAAKLSLPFGVAAANGNVYIADAGNNRIRMINSSKIISTIAGTGTAGSSGDGALATAAETSYPTAVAADATGNVFFIENDLVNNKQISRVRRVDASTKFISTILNNGHILTGIATDKKGNIYVSDSTAFSVLEITPGTFAVQTIAGNGSAGYAGDGGAATSAQFNYPGGLAVDASGNVYVADVKNNVVRKFVPSSTKTPKIANNIISTTDSTVTCDGKITIKTLTGTVPTGGTGAYTYQWKQSPDSVVFTTIGGAASQNYAVNATITKTTYYRRFVTSGSMVDSGNAISFHPRVKPVPAISLGKGTLTICKGTKDTLTATSGYLKYSWSNGADANHIIDSLAGTFYVTVTDSFGCKGTSASDVIKVNAAPAIPTITSTPAAITGLCPGTVVTLSSSTGTTYKWSNAATTESISVTAAGSYTVTVANASGCTATSAAKVVSYEPCATPATPATSTITSVSAVLKWRKVACAADYYVQYAISSSTAWTTATVPAADTTYSLTGLTKSTTYKWQVATVCTTSPSVITSAYTAAVTFTTLASSPGAFDGSTESASIADGPLVDGKPFDAIIYPNPAVNTANLIISGVSGKVIVTVTDLSGRVVWQNEGTSIKQIILPINNFTAGMYFITVKSEKQIKVLKMMKQ